MSQRPAFYFIHCAVARNAPPHHGGLESGQGARAHAHTHAHAAASAKFGRPWWWRADGRGSRGPANPLDPSNQGSNRLDLFGRARRQTERSLQHSRRRDDDDEQSSTAVVPRRPLCPRSSLLLLQMHRHTRRRTRTRLVDSPVRLHGMHAGSWLTELGGDEAFVKKKQTSTGYDVDDARVVADVPLHHRAAVRRVVGVRIKTKKARECVCWVQQQRSSSLKSFRMHHRLLAAACAAAAMLWAAPTPPPPVVVRVCAVVIVVGDPNLGCCEIPEGSKRQQATETQPHIFPEQHKTLPPIDLTD
jgi:hypothetical protein